MLETLVSLVNATTGIVYNMFYYSYKIGQFLVTTISIILTQLSTVFANIITLLSILLESASIFLQDVTLTAQQVSSATLQAIQLVFNSLTSIYMKIYFAISSTLSLISLICVSVAHLVNFLYVAITELIAYFKRLVLLFGSGVWFLVTLLPLLMVYTGNLVIYYVGRLFQEGYEMVYSSSISFRKALTSAFKFATDIPLTTLAGLVIGVILIYVLAKLYVVATSYLTRRFHRILLRIRNVMQSRPIEVRWPVNTTVRGRRPINGVMRSIVEQNRVSVRNNGVKTTSIDTVENNDESKNCVVCLARLKCVLLLPCCHVCLCVECSSELEYYEYNCPICRNHIESTKRIYF